MSALLPHAAIAFAGTRRLAEGPLDAVAGAVASWLAHEPTGSVLVFDAADSRPIDLDLRGTPEEVRARYTDASAAPVPPDGPLSSPHLTARGPGRPRLGVMPREVTLLPRHWEWLAEQPGGASVTLRKLVDMARSAGDARERTRRATEATYRFLLAVAGDAPGFEEAMRALFAGDRPAFESRLAGWPDDVRTHALALLDRGASAGPALDV
jgi:hypothetical protein